MTGVQTCALPISFFNLIVLALVPADRRATLIAKKTGGNVYTFDVHLQGDNETVFFDV